MIFDTDILIWAQRGNMDAVRLIESESVRYISAYTYMEFIQNSQNKQQLALSESFIRAAQFKMLPIDEDIVFCAIRYLQEYSLSSGLEAGDAIIAATAHENKLTLVSSNVKHYKNIKSLKFQAFKPR